MKDAGTDSNELAVDLLWGAKAIADEIGVGPRKTFYMLEKGMIPARKVGALWVSSRQRLRQHFSGTAAEG